MPNSLDAETNCAGRGRGVGLFAPSACRVDGTKASSSAQRSNVTGNRPRLAFLILACIAAVAIGIDSRLASLSERGLWYDELHSVVRLSDTSLSRSDLIRERLSNDPTPPLYYLLLYELKKLGAHSEFHMRLAQNLLFAGGLLLLWTRLNPVPGVPVRLIQSAFLLGSYGLIHYSNELRAYSPMILLAILQSLLLLRIVFALEKGGGVPQRWMIAFALVSVPLTMVHYLGAIAVATSFALLAGILLATGRNRALMMIIAWGFVTCLPVTGWFLATHDFGAEIHPAGLLADPLFLIRQIDRFVRLLSGNIVAAVGLSILVACAIWTAVRALMRQDAGAPIELKAAQWLGAFAIATWAIAYALTFLVLPVVNMRNLLVTAPAIYLALGCVVACWLNSNQRIARAGIVVSILYFLSSAASPLFESNLINLHAKKDWVASAERINALAECAAQPILVVAHPVGFYRYYIDSSKSIELVPIGTPSWTARPGDGEIQQSVALSEHERAQARQLTRSSGCSVKMWYVPTGFVSENEALDLGAQILEPGEFELERVGNAFLFRF
jgi:hypothetical protein